MTREYTTNSQLPSVSLPLQRLQCSIVTSTDARGVPSASQTTLTDDQTCASTISASQSSQYPTWLLLSFPHFFSKDAMEAMAVLDLLRPFKVPAAKGQTYRPKSHSSLGSLLSLQQSSKLCNSISVQQTASDVVVLYCVPFVEYCLPIKGEDGSRTIRPFCDQPELTTFDPNPPDKQRDWNAELAGWVHLMHNLGLHDQSLRQRITPVTLRDAGRMAYCDWIQCAHVEKAYRSWDFVPDDVLRPLAITTLAGLAATTRRLGLS
jgi:hypothetical protein